MSKQTTSKPAAQTPEKSAEPTSPEAQIDRVAMISRRTDGTPDQTPNFEVLADADGERVEGKPEDAPSRD